MIPTLQLSFEAGARRARYLAVSVPLLSAMVLLLLAVLDPNNGNSMVSQEVSEWMPSYMMVGRRRLHHPHNLRLYLSCTRILDQSDVNWDNSINIDEFKVFSNSMADHMYTQQIGSDLPRALSDIFTEFAEKSDGKSTKIIDIYGSGPGERDGVTKAQEEMLEELCNKTAAHIDSMFKDEHDRVDHGPPQGHEPPKGGGVKEEEDKPEPKPKPHHHGPQPLAINASFTLTLPGNMTVEDLIEAFANGEDLGHLGHAFNAFIKGIVEKLGGDTELGDSIDVDDVDDNSTAYDEDMNSADTDSEDGADDNSTRYLREIRPRGRRLNIALAGEPEIYNFVESNCPGVDPEEPGVIGGLIESIGKLVPHASNSTNSSDDSASSSDEDEDGDEIGPFDGLSKKEIACVTAMGKYKIVVDEKEEELNGGLQAVYQRAMMATKSAIDDGGLEKELLKEPDAGLFHVEGHGLVEDDSFDPYEEVEGEVSDDDEGLRTVDIILISVGSVLIFCLCCVLCFVELERKTRPRPGVNN